MANLYDKFNRSRQLLTCSFQIIIKNKKLLLFPLLSLFVGVAIMCFVAFLVIRPDMSQHWTDLQHWKAAGKHLKAVVDSASKGGHLQRNVISDVFHQTVPGTVLPYAFLAAVYLLSMFAATFCNVALYNEIIKALAGEKVSVKEGLRFASRRIPAILTWSLFAGTIGLLIRRLERRFNLLGRIGLRGVSLAWSVASVFVIPVMIREESANPIQLLRSSSATIKKAWGESLIGYAGIGLVGLVVVLGSIFLLFVAMFYSFVFNFPPLFFLALALWIPAAMILIYAVGTAGDIYRCALYIYASEGVVPAPFSAELMDAAWRVKKT
jgi:hypothetical protein